MKRHFTSRCNGGQLITSQSLQAAAAAITCMPGAAAAAPTPRDVAWGWGAADEAASHSIMRVRS